MGGTSIERTKRLTSKLEFLRAQMLSELLRYCLYHFTSRIGTLQYQVLLARLSLTGLQF